MRAGAEQVKTRPIQFCVCRNLRKLVFSSYVNAKVNLDRQLVPMEARADEEKIRLTNFVNRGSLRKGLASGSVARETNHGSRVCKASSREENALSRLPSAA